MNPMLFEDAYKESHVHSGVENTTLVFSNFTPRRTYRENYNEGIIFFGLQYFLKEYLIKQWETEFFDKPEEEVVASYTRRIKNALGSVKNEHVKALHRLGYLPIEILALPEGSLVPYRVAPLIIFNTHKEFAWLTNFLETIISTVNWGPCTSATTARIYRKALEKWAALTSSTPEAVCFLGHDFSMRGLSSFESCLTSGAAHLLFFKGSDTIPAIDFMEKYYNADCEKELISCSVPASEHSIACGHILNIIKKLDPNLPEEEKMLKADAEYFRFLMKTYPTGIVSVVADSFDYWATITKTLPYIKDEVMKRDGKVVIRPDSGDPVRIVAGYKYFDNDISAHGVTLDILAEKGYEIVEKNGQYWQIVCPQKLDGEYTLIPSELTEHEIKGSIQCLYEIFGGIRNKKGYIELDSHIGLIFGDGVRLERIEEISRRLSEKGFASTNVCYGIGSFCYQWNVSRDTDGWAIKATYMVIDGEEIEIFKDPKTDNGMKKSAKGLIAVYEENGTFIQKDQVTWDEVRNCAYKTVFLNGELKVDHTLAEIRARAAQTL